MTRPVVLIDNKDSFTANLWQLLAAQCADAPVHVVRHDALSYAELLALAPALIVLSPGPGHPQSAQDVGLCAPVIDHAATHGIPVFGVCLGLQAIIHQLGGLVRPAPQLVHGKTSALSISPDHWLFTDIPAPMTVMRYHSFVGDSATIPDALVPVAWTQPDDPLGDGTPLLMAAAHRTLPMAGVQFHPESIGTPHGAQLLRNVLTWAGLPTQAATPLFATETSLPPAFREATQPHQPTHSTQTMPTAMAT